MWGQPLQYWPPRARTTSRSLYGRSSVSVALPLLVSICSPPPLVLVVLSPQTVRPAAGSIVMFSPSQRCPVLIGLHGAAPAADGAASATRTAASTSAFGLIRRM